MRAREFLYEASIFTRTDKYSYGHKVRAKPKLALTIQQLIRDFDPSEDLEWIEDKTTPDGVIPPTDTPVIQFGTGTIKRHFKRPNNKYLTIVGTDNAIQGELRHAPGQRGSTEKNVGDLSEPVLSAAIVAKLIKRGKDNVEDIRDQDVIDTLNAAISQGNKLYKVDDKNSKIADEIRFTLAVREPTRLFMQSPNFWETYGSLLPSATHYANSGQIDRYADHFYKNGKADLISVSSDGMSAQKARKTDITAYANGKQLKRLNISLKAGSTQFGQQGAGTLNLDNASPRSVYNSSVNFFSPLGITIDRPTEPITSKIAWWKKSYDQAATQLTSMLSDNSARSDAGIISKIASMILKHATKDDETIRLVKLSRKGISSVHNFSGLVRKLLDKNINLAVDYRIGTSQNKEPRPEITIKDTNSGKALIKLGYHATADNKKIWNAISMEPLLADLTSMEKLPKVPQQEPTGAEQSKEIEKPKDIEQQPDELSKIKSLAGTTTPGIANQNIQLQASKIPMGTR